MVREKKFVIGVDGGGTKTEAVLADLNGAIVKIAKAGSSNPRDVGLEQAAQNIALVIAAILKGKKNSLVVSTFIGLPAMEEEFKNKDEKIISELKENKKIGRIFKGEVIVGSDQLVAFRSAGGAKNGIVAICGTGSAIHGWKNGKEALADNIGWVGKGSGSWIGERAAEAIAEHLDGRGQETSLTEMAFKKFKTRNVNNLLEKIYRDPKTGLSTLAVLCDKAADKGDKRACEILADAGTNIACAVNAAACKLGFKKNEKIPLALAGSVFNSKTFTRAFAKNLQKRYDFEILRSKKPVIGAVKIAIELTNNR